MLKNRAKRLFGAAKQQQQQQNTREQNGLELVAGQLKEQQVAKQEYFDFKTCHRTYSCVHCRAHLADHDQLISKLFQGNHGRAYLFNKVVNIGCKQAVQRELLTGLHAVADIYCDNCETTLGWKYEQAFVPSQKYKEGKYIIELVHMLKENNWDLTSYNARQLMREANLLAQQQSATYNNQQPPFSSSSYQERHCNFQQQQQQIRPLARRTAANRLPVIVNGNDGGFVEATGALMVLDVARETQLGGQQPPEVSEHDSPADGATVTKRSPPTSAAAAAAEAEAEAALAKLHRDVTCNAKASEVPSVTVLKRATQDEGVSRVTELTADGCGDANDRTNTGSNNSNIFRQQPQQPDNQSSSASSQSLCSSPTARSPTESLGSSSAAMADSGATGGAISSTQSPTATNPACSRGSSPEPTSSSAQSTTSD